MNQVIGKSVNRQDGRAKVTGQATYGAEHQIPNLVHGYLVTATIAKGSIRQINTQKAAAMPGVIAVFTHKNPPKIFKPSNDWINSKIYEARLPLSDNQIHYAGQIVGLVVADTLERARHAAHQIEIAYETQPPQINVKQANYQQATSMFGEDMEYKAGEFETGDVSLDGKATVEATYTTETEIHAPMEPHALVAHWSNNDAVTIYEPTQWVKGSQRTYAELFGIPQEKVRIVSPYIGGAFGCKAFPWSHGILCIAAAREIKRPLKVVVSRRQMTANTGHRSSTEQTIRLAANSEGKLTASEHLAKSCTSPVDVFTEPCTSTTPVMYATPNMRLKQEIAVLNVGTPTFMRAPGENPGMFALESAMDELAWELNLDPVELRLRN